MSILDDLTPSQLEAVTHRDGPMLVIAGAGSGKTRVVTRRIAWLLSQGVWPEQILAMTFTNKAAREMRERVVSLTGRIPYNIGTFHSCCARFLRRDIMKLECGRTRDFTIYDTDDQSGVIKRCIGDIKERVPKEVKPGLVSHIISQVKNSGLTWEDACAENDVYRWCDVIQELGSAY
ncbi:MAG: UvrD-helicase domain-containing protein, partial [Victivallales bacterium]|nr:UvrD-helicase domain-containing protein [Victivallales bacterium]